MIMDRGMLRQFMLAPPGTRRWTMFGLTVLLSQLLASRVLGQAALPTIFPATDPAAHSAVQAPLVTVRNLIQLREDLAEELQQLERESESATGQDVANYIATLLGHLKYLDSTYAQQQIVAERAKEVQAEREQVLQQAARNELLGSDSIPSQSFVELERLRDNHDDVAFQLGLVDSELKSTASLLESLKEQYGANERHRRQLRETLELERAESRHATLQRELRVVELRGQIAEELIALRSQEQQVKQLERQLLLDKRTAYDEQIRAAAAHVRFTQQDLDLFLKRLDDEQTRINQLVVTQQQTLRQFERQLVSQTGPLDRETTERARVIRRTLHRGIADANDSLSTVLLVRHAWKIRFRLLNNLASQEELQRYRSELHKFLERIRDAQLVQQTRSQETRLDADVANRVQAGDPTDPLADLQAKLISEAFRESGKRNRLLRQGERLYARVQAELDAKLGTEADTATWEDLRPLLSSCWTYELLAVDDRPITVGKLCLALVMVISGVLFSRALSRTVGNRMLPKLGMHQGASLATQTIAFYLLVMLFGFFTLEYLNIPLTVLTFFGGAAAIAVGFGSQNILNNFISGLIILGEQPIRVGDLIEVEGLHGTIEHIGGRSTRVRTGTNFTIIIPNSKFVENTVKNLTRSSSEIRTVVRVGVAYGSDVEQVSQLLRRAVDEAPLVLKRPEPVALFTDFGESTLNFEIHFWIHMRTLMDAERAGSLVRKNIDRLFREHQVSISFPQRDVHVEVTSPIEFRLPTAAAELLEFPQKRAG